MKPFLCLVLSVVIFLLSLAACGTTREGYRTDLAAEPLMSALTAAVSSDAGYIPAPDGFVNASAFGAEHASLLAAVDEYAIRISDRSDMNIDELGIFRVKEGYDPQAVAAITEAYLRAQQLRYRDLLAAYNPAELPKAENGRVTVCGRYVLYTLLDNTATAAAQDAFVALLRTPDTE